ncbi:MAG: A24 family peptidase [Treponema sp.]
MMDFITGHPLYITCIIFLAFSVPIIVSDIKTKIIPDFAVYLGVVTMLCYRFACTRDDLIIYIAACVLSVLLFVAVRYSSKRGMGWGDVKYSALCGIYAGPVAVFAGYIIAAALCGIWYSIMKKKGKISKSDPIPFAPFMAIGTFAIALVPIIKSFF